MNVDTVNILIKGLVSINVALITAFVIPWLKNRIGESKLAEIQKYAEIVVRCAEQIFSPEEWQRKKAYALSYITDKANEIGIEMTEEDLNSLIESTVNYIKYGTEYSKE